jgi:membrane protease YdiL (CAAX protease family)
MPGAATGSARCATSAELGDDSRPTPPPMSRYKQPTPARHSRIAQPRNCPGRLQPVQTLRRHPTGFFEEIGWRGYLPPKLATGYPRLAPALVGLLHGIWHLPLMLLTTARVRDQHRFGRTDPQYPHVGSLPVYLIATVLPLLLLGGQWEEPGWMGYAQRRYQQRFVKSVLMATLVVGILRVIWHTPLLAYGTIPVRLRLRDLRVTDHLYVAL